MAKLKSAVSEDVTAKKEAASEATESQSIKGNSVKVKAATTTENAAIPEYADKVLKIYPNYAQLAVDAQGGVYIEGSQHIADGKAILYKNPYYKL